MTRNPALKTLQQLWWAPVLCTVLAWLVSHTDTARDFEWRTLDWRTQARVPLQPPADSRLLLILFDDETENNFVSWPPPRNYHGQLIELMSIAGLRVATMDVFLTSERDPESDSQMAAGVQAARERGTEVVTGAVRSEFEISPEGGNVEGPTRPLTGVTGDPASVFTDQFAALPYPGLRAASYYGFVDVEKQNRDGIVRELPLVVRIGDKLYPGLALQTLLRYYRVDPARVRGRLGGELIVPTAQREIRIPMNERGLALVNYRYEAQSARPTIEVVGYRSMLLGLHARFVEPNADALPPPPLRGRIAVIGLYSTGNADAGPSPLASYSPLPLLHANLIDNALSDDFAREANPWAVWGGLLILGWLGLLASGGRSVQFLTSCTVIVACGYVLAAFGAWIAYSVAVPLVAPMLGYGLTQFVVVGRRIVEEQRAKQAIKGMFGAYVSPHVVEQLVAAGQPPQLGGHEEELTAYFSDIQSFSTFSEQLAPPQLVELMNEYLTACTDIVQEEGGTLDKYIGDAVVAMFGAPIPQKDHAYRACLAAVRVQMRIEELRQAWRAEGERWPEIVKNMRTRIGLNTGRAVVGNMGSRTRFNYTMLGDDVNLAARMESGAKSWGVFQLCTEATRAACVEHGGDRIIFRPLGRIVVKGRRQGVPIHEIVGLRESVAPQTHECLAAFAAGLDCYLQQDWTGARAKFNLSATLEPLQPQRDARVADNPSTVFLRLVEEYQQHPPPANWDGTHVMQEK